jgi:Mg2+-importing ATPase
MQLINPVGLSTFEANSSLSEFGPNQVSQKQSGWFQILLRQFKSPFIYLLLAASAVSFLLSSPTDAVVILVFIAINSGLGFYQEFTSHKTLEALEKYLKFDTLALRDGNFQSVSNSQLVPKDIIKLAPGNIIPADVVLISAIDLLIDESSLSGESLPVPKKALDKAFSGTSVTTGSAVAEIVSTGSKSTMGKIALASQSESVSTFEKDISSFSRFVLKLVLVTLFILFLVNYFFKGNSSSIVELLLFCIALAVSVIPEALPVVITFSLSRGASHLARKKVIVKKLLSIEDLGGIQILATDKTGTLTENRLTLSELSPGSSKDVLILAAAGNSNSSDPFEIAINQSLTPPQIELLKNYQLLKSFPFDPIHRTSSAEIRFKGRLFTVVRGAPESLLLPKANSRCQTWLKFQAVFGRRCLAVVKKTDKSSKFIGLISFSDPIKKSSAQAVSIANKLGVQIKILTGDSPEVAATVAREIGLISSTNQVVTGDVFCALSALEQKSAIDKFVVFARTSPFQKNSIVDLLQTKYSVGYLGDGINDAIALQSADVGMAVSNASQVARQAADIVLLEKDLGVLVNGIKEGRIIAANTSKYITTTMASNFGNFYAVAVSSLFIPFLPMLPLQILALNLLSDFPMISIATDNVDAADISSPTRFQVHKFIDLAMVLGTVSTVFDFLFFALYFKISEPVLQTNWFIGSILTELVFIYSIRSRKLFFRAAPPSTSLIVLSLLAVIVTLILPFTNFGKSVFGFESPTAKYLITNLVLVSAYFISTETVKLIYYRLHHPKT